MISRSIAGTLTERGLTHPNARISINSFPNSGRLKDFDLVVLPFSEFEIGDGHHRRARDPYKDIFDKQALEALDEGTTFCFVHHNENVPGPLLDYGVDGYDPDARISSCFERQAGFRWIHSRKIRIVNQSQIILNADLKRGEFGTFLKKWGASHNYFITFADGKFDDVLYSTQGVAIGFCINWTRGTIIYLPFQANHASSEDLRDGLASLIDSLLTYKSKRIKEFPDWAKAPLFANETRLAEDRAKLLQSVETIDGQMAPYQEAKTMLVANEHDLELAVPEFISGRLGIQTHKVERFVEDFLILDSKKETVAICEVKSVTKGFKKSAIYDVYNHREAHDLPETFPAVLFVNFNLQAGSWATKGAPIQKDDCEIAVKNRVLIVRIEDLVQLWDSVMTKRLTVDAIMKSLTKESGWLECRDAKIIIHG